MAFWNKQARKSDPIPTQEFSTTSPINFMPLLGYSSINWGGSTFMKDFLEIPEVNGLIGLKAAAFANGILKIVSKQTGEEVTNNEPIVQVLRNPNGTQSQREFIQQSKYYREIYGNEIMYFLFPLGMPNNLKAIYQISPEIVTIDEQREPYFLSQNPTAKYYYEWDARKVLLRPDEFLHINRANVTGLQNNYGEKKVSNYATSNNWGTPVLASQQGPVANIRAAYNARNTLIEKRGALGILTNRDKDGVGASMPLNPKEKEKLQKEWTKYGFGANQYQIIMTSLNLEWQQIAIDIDKLKLYDEVKESTKSLCLAFGIPYEMIASEQTYDNKLRAERQFYQDTIIPEANEWVEALNRWADTRNRSWKIVMTYDHLPIFQDNIRERAVALGQITTALSKALADGAITIQQYQSELLKFGI